MNTLGAISLLLSHYILPRGKSFRVQYAEAIRPESDYALKIERLKFDQLE